MIENVSTQLTVFHCFAHCLLPGRAFAPLYVLLFLEKEAEIGGRDFSDQFKKIIQLYKNVGYNLDIMSGCKPNHNLKLYGFLFNCTTVGQASDSMTALA